VKARRLPHSIETEASIIGGILLRQEVLAELPDLEPGDFFDLKHRHVFEAMRILEAASMPIDVVTIEAELARRGKLDAVGGPAFLGELTLQCPTASNVVAYTVIVRGYSMARAMMLEAGEVAEMGYAEDLDPKEYLADAEQRILKVARRGHAAKPRTMAQAVAARWKQLGEQAGKSVLVPTGIVALDVKIGGLPRGVISVIAARPKMGKSSAALTIAGTASVAGLGVAVFTLEDSESVYADRGITRFSGVPIDALRKGTVNNGDIGRLTQAAAKFRERTNWLVYDRLMTASEIARELRRAKAMEPTLSLAIIDYLQIVKRNPALNEEQALREILAELFAIAKELDIACLVLSQLNRNVENREDKRPNPSDLRGSGSIEEVARLVMFLYRGVEYNKTPVNGIDYDCSCVSSTYCRCCPSDEEWKNQAQINVSLNSNGEPGIAYASWHGPTMTLR